MNERLKRLRPWALSDGGLPIVWVVLTVIALVPIWHARLLPLLDTPNHLALARAWHSFHDPSYRISEFYTLRIRPVPYLAFYWVIHMLMYVVSIETANKLFLSLYLILFPLSILSLARALKRSPWLAVGGFALAYSQPWIYGFSSYLMSAAFMLFSFAALLRFFEAGRRRDLALLFVLSIITYLFHILPWFVFGLGAIAVLYVHWRKWRRGALAAAAMFPSLLLAVIAIRDDQAEHGYISRGSTFNASWRDFPTSVLEFPRRVMELFPGKVDTIVLITIAMTIVALLIWKGSRDKAQSPEDQRVLPILLLVFALAYLSIPFQINKPLYWWYVSPRLPSLMAPFLLLWPAAKLRGRERLVMLPVIAACIILPLKLARLYREFSLRNAPFVKLVNEIPLGAPTMVVTRGMMRGGNSAEESGDPSSSGPVYWHFSSWPMALKGGYDAYMFDQGIPVRPRVQLRAPLWSTMDNFDLRQAPDFDFYLVRFAPPSMTNEPSLRAVDQIGDWTLFKRVGKLTDEP